MDDYIWDIGKDLRSAYDDGYAKGWAEAKAYILHCGDETPTTNADRIRAMTDEELAEYMGDVQMFGGCPNHGARDCVEDCADCWLKWLKEECER